MRAIFALFCLLAAGAAAAQTPATDKPLMLVAMPSMQGLYRHAAVIVVPAGNHHLGFVVNRATRLKAAELFPQHASSAKLLDPVHFGGPDMADTLFAVVRGDPGGDALPLFGELYLATSAAAIARVIEQSPAEARFFAGFIAWEAGELQKEIARGHWYVTHPDAALFFRRDCSRVWEELIERLRAAQNAASAERLARTR